MPGRASARPLRHGDARGYLTPTLGRIQQWRFFKRDAGQLPAVAPGPQFLGAAGTRRVCHQCQTNSSATNEGAGWQ